MDSLNYLFEVSNIHGPTKDILYPDESDMVTNHFSNGSFISMSVKKSLVDGAHTCLHISALPLWGLISFSILARDLYLQLLGLALSLKLGLVTKKLDERILGQ